MKYRMGSSKNDGIIYYEDYTHFLLKCTDCIVNT